MFLRDKWAPLGVSEEERKFLRQTLAALIVTAAIGMTLAGLGPTAQAQSPPRLPPAAVTDSVRVSDPSTGLVLNSDFERLFFVPSSAGPITNIGRTDLIYQGKPVQARAFMFILDALWRLHIWP
jgi:hypothetical protein